MNAAVSKTVVGLIGLPRVRISPPPLRRAKSQWVRVFRPRDAVATGPVDRSGWLGAACAGRRLSRNWPRTKGRSAGPWRGRARRRSSQRSALHARADEAPAKAHRRRGGRDRRRRAGGRRDLLTVEAKALPSIMGQLSGSTSTTRMGLRASWWGDGPPCQSALPDRSLVLHDAVGTNRT